MVRRRRQASSIQKRRPREPRGGRRKIHLLNSHHSPLISSSCSAFNLSKISSLLLMKSGCGSSCGAVLGCCAGGGRSSSKDTRVEERSKARRQCALSQPRGPSTHHTSPARGIESQLRTSASAQCCLRSVLVSALPSLQNPNPPPAFPCSSRGRRLPSSLLASFPPAFLREQQGQGQAQVQHHQRQRPLRRLLSLRVRPGLVPG